MKQMKDSETAMKCIVHMYCIHNVLGMACRKAHESNAIP